MTPDAISALIAAFNNLGSLYWAEGDFVLGDVGNVTEEGVDLHLARDLSTSYQGRETITHRITFTWGELTGTGENAYKLEALALARWEQAQQDAEAEKTRRKREQEAEERAATKRRRAAGKGARKKRELDTLARLIAKHGAPQTAPEDILHGGQS